MFIDLDSYNISSTQHEQWIDPNFQSRSISMYFFRLAVSYILRIIYSTYIFKSLAQSVPDLSPLLLNLTRVKGLVGRKRGDDER